MGYKVLYYEGEEISLKTKALFGYLSFDGDGILIQGESHVSVRFNDIQSVDLFRLHNTGRMLKIVHNRGTLFVSVIRFMLFGYFAIVNFFATGTLKKKLQEAISN